MRVKQTFKAITLAIIIIGTVSCSSPTKEYKFNFNVSTNDAIKTWPRGTDTAYYRFLGDIYGEDNLAVVKQKQESTLNKIWQFITGNATEPSVNLKRPQAVVGDHNNNLYISDVSHQGIFVFDTQKGTMKIWKKATSKYNFISPIGLALGADNELLVADSELGQVIRLDLDGNPIGVIDHPSLKRPTGVARSPLSGEIYVSDTQQDNIKVFNQQGELLRVFGRSGEGELEFNAPTFLAWHVKGLLVSDTLNARVQLISLDNDTETFLHSYGHRGMRLGNLSRPKGVSSDSNGNIYIIESYFDHLLVYNEQAQFLLPLGGTGYGAGEFYLPSGIWVDKQDKVYIADMMNGRVSVFQFLGSKL